MNCCDSNGCIEVEQYGDHIRVHSTVTSTTMQCTPAEWEAFLTDLGDGKWAHVSAVAVQA